MEITAKIIEQVLKNELIGKDVGWSNSIFYNAVQNTVRQLTKSTGRHPLDFTLEEKKSMPNYVMIMYKYQPIGSAAFKKQRGAKDSYGGYEWSFKDVTVQLYGENNGIDFKKTLEYIDNDEKQELELANEVFQMIKEKLSTDTCGARTFIKYLDQNSYKLN